MSQRRFVNFGTDADASKVKAINSVLAGPQLLRASEPFLQIAPPDQLVVQPHAVIFESGIILDETEQTTFTVPTTFTASDYTLVYEHVDEDIIGGTAATLELRSGLFQSLADSVIIGWVRYPGGSVALDASMIFPARVGQLRPQNLTREVYASSRQVVAQAPTVTITSNPNVLSGQTIPATPYEIAFGSGHVSRFLAVADQQIRIYDHTAASPLARITSGTPSTGEFILSSASNIVTFAAADVGNQVDIADITYGQGLELVANASATDAGIVDVLYSFAVTQEPIRAVTIEYVPLTSGYVISAVEALDIANEPIALAQSSVVPTTIDGTEARLVVRLLDGDRFGTTGGSISIRVRHTVPASGSGLLRRVRATNYDLPF